MNSYRIEWIIDIDADTPREAAQKALTIQRDAVNSTATVFGVLDLNGDGTLLQVDLMDDCTCNGAGMHHNPDCPEWDGHAAPPEVKP